MSKMYLFLNHWHPDLQQEKERAPSDDMDMDWTPAESETCHERQGKRKVPESLTIMEGDQENKPLIMETRSEDTYNIPPIHPAPRDVALVPPPASIFVRPSLRPASTTTSVEVSTAERQSSTQVLRALTVAPVAH